MKEGFIKLPLIGKLAYLLGLLCMIPVGYMVYVFLSFTLPIILVFMLYGSVIVLGVWAFVHTIKGLIRMFKRKVN